MADHERRNKIFRSRAEKFGKVEVYLVGF